MEKAVQELKGLIRELILELGDLRERVSRLEAKEVLESSRAVDSKEEAIKLQGESFEQLGRIYDEGYHVCPIAYGEPRRNGCLFCMAFLGKE